MRAVFISSFSRHLLTGRMRDLPEAMITAWRMMA